MYPEYISWTNLEWTLKKMLRLCRWQEWFLQHCQSTILVVDMWLTDDLWLCDVTLLYVCRYSNHLFISITLNCWLSLQRVVWLVLEHWCVLKNNAWRSVAMAAHTQGTPRFHADLPSATILDYALWVIYEDPVFGASSQGLTCSSICVYRKTFYYELIWDIFTALPPPNKVKIILYMI